MKNVLPLPRLSRRRTSGQPDRRGTAILLVLVSIVLIAIAAGTLIQVSRFERIAPAQSNVEPVIDSVVQEIINQLNNDILNEDGDAFRVTGSERDGGGGDEFWDFPYTNYAVNERETPDGTRVAGGAMDDSWLASSMPDYRSSVEAGSLYDGEFNTTHGVWRKITSLTGEFLIGTGANLSDLGAEDAADTPTSNLVNNINSLRNRDMNIRANASFLVDADGDGIGDSRWEWAPLRQVGGTEYVMAVRIIDLSARADLNVVTGNFGDAGAQVPRGDSPAELSGEQVVLDLGGTATEWANVMSFRSGSVLANYDNNQSPATAGSRRFFWEKNASLLSNTFNRNGETGSEAFGLDDTVELLHRNGFNSVRQSRVEQEMPDFLRRNDRSGNADGDNTDAEVPFQLANRDAANRTVPLNDGRNVTKKDFWELDPRKRFTSISGSMVSSPPLTNAGEDLRLRLDINRALSVDEPAQENLRELDNAILEVLNAATNDQRTALLDLYPHINTVEELADRITVNLADYADEDNVVDVHDSVYGFEALPHLSEIYIQRVVDGTVTGVGPTGDNNLSWAIDPSDQIGYVIEISNPFSQRIGGEWYGRQLLLNNVYIKFGSGDALELSALTGEQLLEPGQVIHLYRNATGTAANTDDDGLEMENLYRDAMINDRGNIPNIDVIQVDVSTETDLELPTNDEMITISLHAEEEGVSAGSAATWAYNACDVQLRPATLPIMESVDATLFPMAPATGLDTDAYQAYLFASYKGVGQGLRMMTVTKDNFTEDISTFTSPSDNCDRDDDGSGPTGTGLAIRKSVRSSLANEIKPGEPTGIAALSGQQLVWHDNQRERVQWVGDILQLPLIGVNQTGATDETTAAAFAQVNPSNINDLLLPYKTAFPDSGAAAAPAMDLDNTVDINNGTYGTLNLPISLMLLERLTTFNPATDGEDGDGDEFDDAIDTTPADGVDSEDFDETLVPGRINLNTVPEDLLASMLPINDQDTREDIAEQIVRRREHLAQSNVFKVGADNIPAIQHVSSLYEQLESLEPAGNTNEIGTYTIDLNDYEFVQGSFPLSSAGDGIADDREEEIMLTKWLNEMCSVRSDVFAAYIVVQGYPAGDFNAGVVESQRVIVLFSRAGVGEDGNSAVELGRWYVD